MGIYAKPDHPHLTDELLTKADQLWQQAESLVAADPDVLRRVKISRLSVDYAILERGRLHALGKLPANARFAAVATARFNPFFAALQQSKVARFHEGQPLDKEAYRRGLANDLQLRL